MNSKANYSIKNPDFFLLCLWKTRLKRISIHKRERLIRKWIKRIKYIEGRFKQYFNMEYILMKKL